MISLHTPRRFGDLINDLKDFQKRALPSDAELRYYGELGVAALAAATPKDTGTTAKSWKYKVVKSRRSVTLSWVNTNLNGIFSIALLIQEGHGTKSGTWVEGIDYINPELAPIFDRMVASLRKEVSGGNNNR